MNRTVRILLVVALASFAVPSVAGAQATNEGSYQIEVFNRWDTAEIDVLIIPPKHGQIFNGDGFLNGGDPAEVTPLNSYLEAIEDSIAEWDEAFALLAPDWFEVNTDPYVVGRDIIPPDALSDPEIVINSSEHKGQVLGMAVRTGTFHCVIDNSMFFTMSFTYEDMFNISTHEFGHCLGAGHVIGNEPQHDVMFPTYRDSIGAQGNHLHCVSTLDMRAVEVGFGAVFGRSDSATTVTLPRSEYASTCAPPSTAVPAENEPEPESSATASVSPEPDASPSAEPSVEPSPTPTSSPTPVEPAEDVFRMVRLKIRRHLVARGRLLASEDAPACTSDVQIRILRRRSGKWRSVKRTTTDVEGRFRVALRDRVGAYRATVSRTESSDGRGCTAARSAILRHRHNT